MSIDIENLPTLLQRAREATVVDLRALLSQHELTEQQWRVIHTISVSGEINAQDLAEKSVSRQRSRLRTSQAAPY